jgi:hypothetical protein
MHGQNHFKFLIIKPTRCTNFQICFGMKLYMFRTVPLSIIIRSLFTVHSAMVYVTRVCRQLSSRTRCSCPKAVDRHVGHIPLMSVQWINSWWWWTEELSETCRVSCQNKFVKLVHLVGFIIKKTGCYVCIVVIIQMMIVWETCQLYIISTFPTANHLSNHPNQVQ